MGYVNFLEGIFFENTQRSTVTGGLGGLIPKPTHPNLRSQPTGVCHGAGWLAANDSLGGGFKRFLCSAIFGEMIQIDEPIFQMD